MRAEGFLRKLKTIRRDAKTPIEYHLPFVGRHEIHCNPLIGQKVKLIFTGKMACIHCGTPVKKTFQQGYCFPCTQKLAETDICIVKPELCHHHLGSCRDDGFATRHCFISHVVYLAISSGIKVGITREHQKMTRWADQGATAALEMATVPDRRTAGLLEIEIARSIPDKTNWRLMLQGNAPETDLVKLKSELFAKIPTEWKKYLSDSQTTTHLTYPVLEYPRKINSYNFDKNPLIEDQLNGIKGQYLIFQNGVINIRKFQGYEVQIEG